MILHITSCQIWETAGNAPYEGDTLATEGFIHCSTLQQVLGPANGLFHGRKDLMLLVIDPDLLTADLVYEDCYEAGEEFPHVYGPLNRDAVTAVVDFPSRPDGTFALPDGLIDLLAG